MPSPEPISEYTATLGEGPRWTDEGLIWLDIVNRKLLLDRGPDGERTLDLPHMPGCVAPAKSGGLLVAWEKGFARLDPHSGATSPLCDPEADEPRTRFNDGGVDPAGRFWAGTMGYNAEAGIGSLYMLDHDGKATRQLTGVSISNGIVWSPDAATMYYVDSPTRAVQAFDYDQHTGRIDNPRAAVRIDDDGAIPDGMTIDAEGNLWIALWDGGVVVCHDPRTGRRLERIEVPAQRVTACAFGGPDLHTLFITTATMGLSDDALKQQPLAGRLFRVEPGVRGAALPQASVQV